VTQRRTSWIARASELGSGTSGLIGGSDALDSRGVIATACHLTDTAVRCTVHRLAPDVAMGSPAIRRTGLWPVGVGLARVPVLAAGACARSCRSSRQSVLRVTLCASSPAGAGYATNAMEVQEKTAAFRWRGDEPIIANEADCSACGWESS
jgi:hypothetical protein